MKDKIDYKKITAKELFENSKNSKRSKTKASDIGVRVGLLLLFPYIVWLSKYNNDYVKTIHNKVIHLNFDGIMLTLHNLFSNANLIVHEAGHGVCYILHCPQFFTAMNGTNFQLLLPLFFIYYYHKRDNNILVGLGFIWLAQNLIYVAWYMSYAQTPNAYPFFLGEGTHDFWYMFSELGVLKYDWLISGIFRTIAVIILYGAYFYLLFASFFQSNPKKISSTPKSQYPYE